MEPDTGPRQDPAHGSHEKELASLDSLAAVENLKHRPLNFQGVREEDVAVVSAVLESMYLMNARDQTRGTLRQTNLEIYPNAYLLTVKLRGTAVIDSSALMALWDSSPARIDALRIVPAIDTNTGTRYLAINVTVRSTRSSPSVRFVLHQELHQTLRVQRAAFYDLQRNLTFQADAGEPDIASETVGHGSQDDSRNSQKGVAHHRQPWSKLDHRADRTTVERLLTVCFDMAVNPTDARFWHRVKVDGPAPGRSDRIIVRWTLPEGEPLDVTALYTLHLQEPTGIDTITCRQTASGRALVIVMTLFSIAAKESTVQNTRVLNIYGTHVGSNASMTRGIHGPGMTYKPGSGATPFNPATIAERQRNSKRSREADTTMDYGPPQNVALSAPSSTVDPEISERARKRQRLEQERERARDAEAQTSVSFAKRVYGAIESFI